MIRNPNDITSADKKIRLLIAGYPGIGKSTLALSAPKPLYVDVDFGIDRIEPRYRAPFIQPATYQEVLDDLTPANVAPFESIVFDTGGKLISLIGEWAKRKDPKYGQRDGSLSLKGYGFVGREFTRLMDFCFYELKKHVIIVFHAVEDKDNDNIRLRIKCEGSTKNSVWEPMDLGGFVEMYGNNRTIGFSNCERYYAKGTRGINGIIQIPNLTNGSPNDFLARLFADYNAKNAAEIAENNAQQESYDRAMTDGRAIIEAVTNAAGANDALAKLRVFEHALTSRTELAVLLKAKAKQMGLRYDRSTNSYIDPDPKPAQPAQEEANA